MTHAELVDRAAKWLRRIGQSCPPGVSIRAYTYETECRASLGVALGIGESEAANTPHQEH